MNKIQIPKEIFESIFLQQGGQVDNKMNLNKALTGQFMTGMDKQNPMQQPNAEIESGEHVQQPGGPVQEVLGKKHSQGGEDVVLEDNARVLSDHLKIGGVNARKFSKLYDVELKASDTYATVLDKINKKSGLTKLVKEEEELIKKLDRVTKESKDESSLGLNTQYLSGKINELESNKKPLEQKKEQAFNEIFNVQEESKPEEKKETYSSESTELQEEFKFGGVYSADVMKLAKDYNIPQDRLEAIMKTYAQDGILNEGDNPQVTPRLSEDQTNERFNTWVNSLRGIGYEGSNDLNEARAWQEANDRNAILEYYNRNKGNQKLNAKHLDIAKNKYSDVFKKLGIDIKKPSSTYTDNENRRIQDALGNRFTEEDILSGHNDKLKDWRAPLSSFKIKPAGLVHDNIIKAPVLPNLVLPPSTYVPIPPSNETPDEKIRRETESNLLLLPNQNPMLPNSLGQSLKMNDRAYQLQKTHISPEQAIAEGNRNQTALVEQINNMPGAQRSAVLAQMTGNQQEAINKATFDANRYNAVADTSTENQQAAMDNQSNRINAQHALSYEQRTQRAQALTDNDLANYYNTVRQNNVRNYNEINDINLRNAKYDNFQYNGNSFDQIAQNPNYSTDGRFNKTPEQRLLDLEEANKAAKKEQNASKRIASKKNGGRFKK